MSQPTQLARELTQATHSGAPLGEALAAAAEGAPDRRLARHLKEIAKRIERGESLEKVLAKESLLPPHLAGLLRASFATGQPSLAIADWLFARQKAQSHWRNVQAALAYPLATLLATYFLYVFLSLWLIPDFSKMLNDFGLKIPPSVKAIFLFTQEVAPLSLMLLGGLAVLLLLVRLIGGRSGWSHFMTAVPVVGPLWHWSGSSELYRALAILLERQLPLPEALNLTGDGIADAALAGHCRRLAERVTQGSDLWHALRAAPQLPQSTFPLIRIGERDGTLVASLRTAAELLESRLQTQAATIMHLAPTVVFLLVLAMVCLMVAGFLVPMMMLIRGLT